VRPENGKIAVKLEHGIITALRFCESNFDMKKLIVAVAVGLSLGAFADVKVRFDDLVAVRGFTKGAGVFSDRGYGIAETPKELGVRTFLALPIDGWTCKVVCGGKLSVLTPLASVAGAASQEARLKELGFVRDASVGPFQLFPREENRVSVWRKDVRPGETLTFRKWVVPLDMEIEAPTENVREPVNVDLGRQLFLNGRLVREMSARRVWHHPVKYAGNPVLKTETALEKGGKDGNAMSAPFSGGVWYDGREGLYKCFYHAGWANGEAYATSKDGLAWERPDLDGKGGNLAFRTSSFGDSSAVILDPDAADGYRWKAFNFECGGKNAPRGGRVRVSNDGLSWSEPVQTAGVGDRTTVFYNPFTKKWGYSIRSGKAGYGRSRAYAEHADFIEGAKTMPDRRDWVLEAAGGREENGEELYNFDCVAYESVLIGLAMVMNPPQNTYWSMKGVPKMTDLRFGFNADPTRWDGWQFPETKLEDGFFIPQTRQYGTWDMGYLQSNAAICLVIADELRFYYSGFAGDVTKKNAFQSNTGSGMYANATMGFATLRRDGFCSIEDGTVRTKRLVFTKGDRLWLNVDAKRGAVKVSASDADGVRLGEATYASVDATRLMSFALPADKPFELTFDVTGGAKLYSFWTSDAKGRSGGYLAGGSPESKTLRDVE